MPSDDFSKFGNHGRTNNTLVAPPLSRQSKYGVLPRLVYDNPLKPHEEWRELAQVTVKLKDIWTVDLSTYTIMKAFSTEGDVCFVRIFTDNGRKEGTATVKFSTPPHNAFWNYNQGKYLFHGSRDSYLISIELYHGRKGKESRSGQVKSPIKLGVFYDEKIKLVAGRIHFGIMIDQESIMPHHVVKKHQLPVCQDLIFEVDLRRLRIIARFDVLFCKNQPDDRINRYMLQIPFASLGKIQRMDIRDKNTFALVISLTSPPQYYRKSGDDSAGHSDENLDWNEFSSWYRQTDIAYDILDLRNKKVSLHKEEEPIIDIGRWTTYLFEFSTSLIAQAKYDIMKQALQDFNIEIVPVRPLKKEKPLNAQLWSLLDSPASGSVSSNLNYMHSNHTITLPWEVRYQLEVCISHGLLSEYNINEEFIKKLAAISSTDARKGLNMLEWVEKESDNRFLYQPLELFINPEAMSASYDKDIPKHCAYARKAKITPTSIYFSSPTVETTNRVLRHYARENADGRFLRVQFTDENGEGRINASAKKRQNDMLFSRVFRTLYNGIRIGDRHFEFLAFGNSQFRENGAYFFCPTEHLSCNDIRQWMGNFSSIKIVAKYAARLGQCFSTTRAINGLSKPDLVRIPDVEVVDGDGNKKYCFTDGVGKISPFLAQMIALELGLKSNVAPSAFQFRLGGAKGILVVWPDAKEREVHLRSSQEKFPAIYNGLEIIRCARSSTATLNRQTIIILSALGVADKVFIDMMVEQLANYQNAMTNNKVASNMLLRYIDENSMTINIATMIRNGFMDQRDPFVLSLLHLWRSWSIKLLKEKAKIIVEGGAFVLGCVDETNTLQGYRSPSVARGEQNLEEELPEIFIQVPDKEDPNKYNVVIGICLVGRNPSLHPGDIRVVRAVDVEALHHLRHVVVFPQNGERDVPGMCSGGDLDGDDYFVIWDKNLLPREWNYDAMNYDGPKPKNLHRPVQIVDLMKFFVRFMKNDTLPTIAHAHIALSDFLVAGVKDPKCLELAALHSKAVDYVKTGEPAEMPTRLTPTRWPHFMEKKFKSKEQQYHSTKILGQLYDKVERVAFTPQYQEPFDQRILRAYNLSDSLLKSVRQVKTQYDLAMRRIMVQQEIATEFEIWSTFVLSRPPVGSDYKQQEEIGRVAEALKDHFRAVCKEKAGGTSFEVLGPFVAGMYKVTKEEMDIALAECRSTRTVGGREVPKRKMEPRYMPLISFPWLFEKEMGRITTGIDASDDLQDSEAATSFPSGKSHKRQGGIGGIDLDDFIQQDDGLVFHRGEELDLFRHVDDSDEDEFIDDGFAQEDHDFVMGENGEAVLDTAFPEIKSSIPAHLDSGTGVEEVVPTIQMDGLINPREVALCEHEAENTDWHKTRPSSATDFPITVEGYHSPTSVSMEQDDVQPQLEKNKDNTEGFLVDLKDDTAEDSSPALDRLQPASIPDTSSKMNPDVPDMLREVERELVRLDLTQSPLQKLAHMVENNTGGSTNNIEHQVKEEIVQLDIKESPLEKLERMVSSGVGDHSDYNEKAEITDEVEEQVLELEVRESPLEKLQRMINS